MNTMTGAKNIEALCSVTINSSEKETSGGRAGCDLCAHTNE